MVTALSWAAYCNGALCLIDSFVSESEPPCELETVVIVTSEKPPILPDSVNELALLETPLFVTIYSSITILPSNNALPFIPSPK